MKNIRSAVLRGGDEPRQSSASPTALPRGHEDVCRCGGVGVAGDGNGGRDPPPRNQARRSRSRDSGDGDDVAIPPPGGRDLASLAVAVASSPPQPERPLEHVRRSDTETFSRGNSRLRSAGRVTSWRLRAKPARGASQSGSPHPTSIEGGPRRGKKSARFASTSARRGNRPRRDWREDFPEAPVPEMRGDPARDRRAANRHGRALRKKRVLETAVGHLPGTVDRVGPSFRGGPPPARCRYWEAEDRRDSQRLDPAADAPRPQGRCRNQTLPSTSSAPPEPPSPPSSAKSSRARGPDLTGHSRWTTEQPLELALVSVLPRSCARLVGDLRFSRGSSAMSSGTSRSGRPRRSRGLPEVCNQAYGPSS